MEQHNIDSRFKKGLENLNRQPSADAWARLQSQLNAPQVAPEPEITQPEEKETKRLFVWWQYAAAALVLLFIGIGFMKNATNLNGKTSPELAVNRPKGTPAQTKLPVEIEVPVSPDQTSAEQVIAQNQTAPVEIENSTENARGTSVKTLSDKNSENQFKPETENALAAAKPKKKKPVLVDPEKLPVADNKPVQPSAETLLAANQATANTVKQETAETKPTGLAGMAIEVIVKKDNSENMLAMQAPVAEEDKDSKIKTIFKQARNLKNGEKVDFQALGVTSDSKLAMGTRSITEKFTKVLDI